MNTANSRTGFLALLSLLVLTACGGGGGGTAAGGGGTATFTIGGSVSGLSGTVVLQNNGGDNLSISANAAFTFATGLANGANYNVTVLTQPAGQTCSVTNGAGSVSGANVTNVTVICAAGAFTVGGTVSGLAGTVVLRNNGGNDLTLTANGPFTFSAPVADGSGYTVSVYTQPAGQSCSVANGSGTIAGANVTNVAITCAAGAFTVGGAVSGLSGTVVLRNNGADNLSLSANGSFTFATALANGSTYNVTVLTQPAGQSCSVVNGSGTVAGANVTNVAITCAANTYTVGGTVTGLSGTVVLQNNGGDNLSVSANSSFNFATALANSSAYNVSVFTQPAGQSCSVANGSGTVAGANVTNVAITCVANTYTVGGTVTGLSGTVVLQNNGGDNLSVSANSSFTFATALANSSAYNVTVLTQPGGQTCTVTNGAGTLSGSNVTNVSVACVAAILPRFAYVANQLSNTVSIYTVDAATGQLRSNGYVTAGTGPFSVAVAPSGSYAYVANDDGTVSQYTVGASGGLTPMTPATVTAGFHPFSITIDPSGRYAYVANDGDATVSQYTIGVTGGLSAMMPATVATGAVPFSAAVDPSGRYAYVANRGDGTVSQYTIGASGALSAMTPATVLAGVDPESVAVDSGGSYVYVANFNSGGAGTISQFTIGASGALSAMNPATVAAGAGPHSIAVDPSARYAYVANGSDGNVSQFTIGATGALTPMTSPTVAAAANPFSVTVDPSGRYVYVANEGANTIGQYAIGATGALTATTVTPKVATRSAPTTLAVTKGTAPVTYTPKFAYVSDNFVNTISGYTIDPASGSLTRLDADTGTAGVQDFAAGSGPASVAVAPSGKFAYAANELSAASAVSAYTINAATGALTALTGSPFAAGAGAFSAVVDPSGRFLYVACYDANAVFAYSIDAGTGALTPIDSDAVAPDVQGFATGTRPQFVAVDPAGRFLYVANTISGNVSAFTINATTGELAEVAGSPFAAGTGPLSVTVDPSARFVYVANAGDTNVQNATPGSVSAYTINAATGALTRIDADSGTGGIQDFAAGTTSWSVTVDPSGRFAYVTNNLSADISAYTINATTGALTVIAGSPFAAGANPRSVTVDPSAKFAFVSNRGTNNVSAYTINATTGALTAIAGSPFNTANGPASVTTTGTIQ